MASSSSSSQSAAKANLLVKRKLGDDFVTKQFLKRHNKDTSDEKTTKGLVDSLQQNSDQANLISAQETNKTLFIFHLCYQTTISEIIEFFKDVVRVVRVRLIVNRKCLHRSYGFVEFASPKEAKKALAEMNGKYLRGKKILLVPKKAPAPPPQYCIDHKVCYKDYFQRGSLLMEEDEGVLFVANLSPQTKILHIKEFFDSVGEVVSVRLVVNHEGKHVGYGFVEFASTDEAKKALENKNGEYLHDHKIFLDVAKKALYPPQPKYNLAEKLCYEDYIRRLNPLIEEDETVEGLNETPDFVEAIAVREKTVFVSGLSSQAEISDIIDFLKDVGEVVHIRLIVDNMGKHVGDGFVEFASANEAKKALEKRNGEYLLDHEIFLDVVKKAPYPLRPKYFIDHKVWYEDYLRRENLLIDEAVEGLEIPDFVEEVASRRKTIFVTNIRTQLSDIIYFFKRVGQIVRIRLIVDDRGEHVGCAFVEFSSADEAEKALVKDIGHDFSLDMVERAPYPLRPKYSLAEKLWSKVESHLIKEGEGEGEGEGEDEEYDDDDDDLQEVPLMNMFSGKKITFSFDD